MSVRWVVLATVAAGACGKSPEKTCRKIAAAVCDHQLECDIVTDVFACTEEFEDSYLCDPEATQEQLDLCVEAAEILECPTAVPFVCFEVLCNRDVGCVEVPTTTVDTDTDTDTDTDATP